MGDTGIFKAILAELPIKKFRLVSPCKISKSKSYETRLLCLVSILNNI